MGSAGQLSRTLNKVFTPITHPLLPMIAAPGQLSAAEINSMLHSLGHMPQLDMYAIGHVRENGHAMFLEKCLNELSLPHRLLSVDRTSHGSIEKSIRQSQFGGAYINPPLPVEGAPYLPTLTEAASAIGQVDTIAVRTTNSGRALIADNVSWKGIRATLTRDFVPSAYKGRSAVVIANTEAHAAAAIYALTSLDVGAIYTIGFHATGHKQLQGMLELDQIDEPFAVISGLPAEKSLAAAPVLKHYSRPGPKTSLRSGRIFIDLANGIKGSGDAVSVAAHLGWNVYACAESMSWTIVEMMRCLLGENVPYAFVRLAAGRGLYT
jgi:3-dehydroquinate dehydratase-1